MKKSSGRDIFVIGFALFSMFFGAGNVIFPPFLGLEAGPKWILGFVCYYIVDIGLALLTMYAIFRQSSAEDILRPVGRIPAVVMMCAIVLCLGPMLAIPRTAAMTYEMAIQPLVGGVGAVLSSVLFFLLIFLCSVRENKVVDIVGKIMTPALLIGLLILIVKGVITPLGQVSQTAFVDNIASEGVKAGYQTMDVLATMLFGAVILHSAENKGYTETKEKHRIAGRASLVAGALLLAVYGGLTYLGASVSSVYDVSVGRSNLVLAIVNGLLGQSGTVLFAVVVALACITTAVGLVSATAVYFSGLFKGKVSYEIMVGVICVFSAVVANVGLDQLVAIAGPILDVVYPPTLVMIALAFLPGMPPLTYRLGMAGALVMSALGALDAYTSVSLPVLHHIPLASLGFGWMLPTLLCCAVGYVVGKNCGRKTSEK